MLNKKVICPHCRQSFYWLPIIPAIQSCEDCTGWIDPENLYSVVVAGIEKFYCEDCYIFQFGSAENE